MATAVDRATLAGQARAAFERRRDVVTAAARQAPAIAEACHQMARRFHVGGTILAFGNGGPTTDAQHVSVEFVHPVIVGKRALPALSLNADAASVTGLAHRYGDQVYAHLLRVLGHPGDIALGLSSDGRCADVLAGLEAAHDAGMLTVALVGDPTSPIATSPAVDHVLTVASDDPAIVKEVHVTTYHVLWELVHVFLEQPGLLTGGAAGTIAGQGSVEALYPFLYDGGSDLDSVLADVAASTRAKFEEAVALRDRVGAEVADHLAACALDVAASFDGGGRLLAFGNGGSSSDAQEVVQVHLAPHGDARSLPALCLTNDVAVVTALSNDVDFDVVFARQVRAFGRPGDIAVGLSTSGNSGNVVQAFAAARDLGMTTVGLAGNTGGEMATLDTIDHLFVVPSSSVHRIQEVQTTLYHVLHDLVTAALPARDNGRRRRRPGRG